MPQQRGAGGYEEFERELDPHRKEEQDRARQELIARLQTRGVHLSGVETLEEIADLMDAVERFESEVDAHGGDLFVDSGTAREPDDPLFVLPARRGHERIADYIARIADATLAVERRRGKGSRA